MTADESIIATLKASGLYEALKAQVGKDMTAGDVHVATTGKDEKKKPNLVVDEPAVAKSGNFQLPITISKVDIEQRLVFGWASISQIDGVDVIDRQGDIIPPDELERAAYEFMLRFRQQGDMHSEIGVGYAVESMVFTAEKEACGLVAKNDVGQQIFGWFVGFKVENDAVWKRVREGELPEFSIGGRAGSVE